MLPGNLVLQLIVPILELKPYRQELFTGRTVEINRTHFGIETTKETQIIFKSDLINRTHFGIETDKRKIRL